jgi:hypothetical protein
MWTLMPSIDRVASTLLLANVALKTFTRQRAFKMLFALSSLLVCGGLWTMWLVSYGQYESFLTSGQYAKLSIEVQCDASASMATTGASATTANAVNTNTTSGSSGSDSSSYSDNNNKVQPFCVPYRDTSQPNSNHKHKLTPSDLLFDMIGSQQRASEDSKQLQQLTTLIASMMMNGLPLLGLADYIYLSDFANNHINDKDKSKLMTYPGYSDKFGSFLNARNREIRVTPGSCWASEFVWHLRNTSAAAKVGE